MNPAISILIRTFNSAGTLPRVLSRLQLLPEDEIIIVDSGSTDDTLAVAARYQARVIIAEKPFNYSKSLNLGFAAARNPWVLVMSSHCIPLSEDFLAQFRSAVAAFPPATVVAYGECLISERAGGESRDILYARSSSTVQEKKRVLGGNSLALYRRDQWEIRRFDESLTTAEDLAWFVDALARGSVAARVFAARVLYLNQANLARMFRKGWDESQMAIKLMGSQGMTFPQLGINFASLAKKCLVNRMPFTSAMRLGAHALGAYLAPKFLPNQAAAVRKPKMT